MWFIIYEDSLFLKIWTLVSVITILYVAIIVPFNLAFGVTYTFTIIDSVFDYIMYVDVIATIFTVNYVHGVPEENLYDIIMRYI